MPSGRGDATHEVHYHIQTRVPHNHHIKLIEVFWEAFHAVVEETHL
jgi:hypothetical protein